MNELFTSGMPVKWRTQKCSLNNSNKPVNSKRATKSCRHPDTLQTIKRIKWQRSKTQPLIINCTLQHLYFQLDGLSVGRQVVMLYVLFALQFTVVFSSSELIDPATAVHTESPLQTHDHYSRQTLQTSVFQRTDSTDAVQKLTGSTASKYIMDSEQLKSSYRDIYFTDDMTKNSFISISPVRSEQTSAHTVSTERGTSKTLHISDRLAESFGEQNFGTSYFTTYIEAGPHGMISLIDTKSTNSPRLFSPQHSVIHTAENEKIFTYLSSSEFRIIPTKSFQDSISLDTQKTEKQELTESPETSALSYTKVSSVAMSSSSSSVESVQVKYPPTSEGTTHFSTDMVLVPTTSSDLATISLVATHQTETETFVESLKTTGTFISSLGHSNTLTNSTITTFHQQQALQYSSNVATVNEEVVNTTMLSSESILPNYSPEQSIVASTVSTYVLSNGLSSVTFHDESNGHPEFSPSPVIQVKTSDLNSSVISVISAHSAELLTLVTSKSQDLVIESDVASSLTSYDKELKGLPTTETFQITKLAQSVPDTVLVHDTLIISHHPKGESHSQPFTSWQSSTLQSSSINLIHPSDYSGISPISLIQQYAFTSVISYGYKTEQLITTPSALLTYFPTTNTVFEKERTSLVSPTQEYIGPTSSMEQPIIYLDFSSIATVTNAQKSDTTGIETPSSSYTYPVELTEGIFSGYSEYDGAEYSNTEYPDIEYTDTGKPSYLLDLMGSISAALKSPSSPSLSTAGSMQQYMYSGPLTSPTSDDGSGTDNLSASYYYGYEDSSPTSQSSLASRSSDSGTVELLFTSSEMFEEANLKSTSLFEHNPSKDLPLLTTTLTEPVFSVLLNSIKDTNESAFTTSVYSSVIARDGSSQVEPWKTSVFLATQSSGDSIGPFSLPNDLNMTPSIRSQRTKETIIMDNFASSVMDTFHSSQTVTTDYLSSNSYANLETSFSILSPLDITIERSVQDSRSSSIGATSNVVDETIEMSEYSDLTILNAYPVSTDLFSSILLKLDHSVKETQIEQSSFTNLASTASSSHNLKIPNSSIKSNEDLSTEASVSYLLKNNDGTNPGLVSPSSPREAVSPSVKWHTEIFTSVESVHGDTPVVISTASFIEVSQDQKLFARSRHDNQLWSVKTMEYTPAIDNFLSILSSFEMQDISQRNSYLSKASINTRHETLQFMPSISSSEFELKLTSIESFQEITMPTDDFYPPRHTFIDEVIQTSAIPFIRGDTTTIESSSFRINETSSLHIGTSSIDLNKYTVSETVVEINGTAVYSDVVKLASSDHGLSMSASQDTPSSTWISSESLYSETILSSQIPMDEHLPDFPKTISPTNKYEVSTQLNTTPAIDFFPPYSHEENVNDSRVSVPYPSSSNTVTHTSFVSEETTVFLTSKVSLISLVKTDSTQSYFTTFDVQESYVSSQNVSDTYYSFVSNKTGTKGIAPTATLKYFENSTISSTSEYLNSSNTIPSKVVNIASHSREILEEDLQMSTFQKNETSNFSTAQSAFIPFTSFHTLGPITDNVQHIVSTSTVPSTNETDSNPSIKTQKSDADSINVQTMSKVSRSEFVTLPPIQSSEDEDMFSMSVPLSFTQATGVEDSYTPVQIAPSSISFQISIDSTTYGTAKSSSQHYSTNELISKAHDYQSILSDELEDFDISTSSAVLSDSFAELFYRSSLYTATSTDLKSVATEDPVKSKKDYSLKYISSSTNGFLYEESSTTLSNEALFISSNTYVPSGGILKSYDGLLTPEMQNTAIQSDSEFASYTTTKKANTNTLMLTNFPDTVDISKTSSTVSYAVTPPQTKSQTVTTLKGLESYSYVENPLVPSTGSTDPLSSVGIISQENTKIHSSVYSSIIPSYLLSVVEITSPLSTFAVESLERTTTYSSIYNSIADSYTHITRSLTTVSVSTIQDTESEAQPSLYSSMERSFMDSTAPVTTIPGRLLDTVIQSSVYSSSVHLFSNLTTPLSTIDVSTLEVTDTQSSLNSSVATLFTDSPVPMTTIDIRRFDGTEAQYINSSKVSSHTDSTIPLSTDEVRRIEGSEIQSSVYSSMSTLYTNRTTPFSTVDINSFEDTDTRLSIHSSKVLLYSGSKTPLSTLDVNTIEELETHRSFYSSIVPTFTDDTISLSTFDVNIFEDTEIQVFVSTSIVTSFIEHKTPLSMFDDSTPEKAEIQLSVFSSLVPSYTESTIPLSFVDDSIFNVTEIRTSVNGSIVQSMSDSTTPIPFYDDSTLENTNIHVQLSVYSTREDMETQTFTHSSSVPSDVDRTTPLSVDSVSTVEDLVNQASVYSILDDTETQLFSNSFIAPSFTDSTTQMSIATVSPVDMETQPSIYSSIFTSYNGSTAPFSTVVVSTIEAKEIQPSLYSFIESLFTDNTNSLSTVADRTLEEAEIQSSVDISTFPSYIDSSTPSSTVAVSTFSNTETRSTYSIVPLSTAGSRTFEDKEAKSSVYRSRIDLYTGSTTLLPNAAVSTPKDMETSLSVYSSTVHSNIDSTDPLSTVGTNDNMETQLSTYSSSVYSLTDNTPPLSTIDVRSHEGMESQPSLNSFIAPSYTVSTTQSSNIYVSSLNDTETQTFVYSFIVPLYSDSAIQLSTFGFSIHGDVGTKLYRSSTSSYTDSTTLMSSDTVSKFGDMETQSSVYSYVVHWHTGSTPLSFIDESTLQNTETHSSAYSLNEHSYPDSATQLSTAVFRSSEDAKTHPSAYSSIESSYTDSKSPLSVVAVNTLQDTETQTSVYNSVISKIQDIETQTSVYSSLLPTYTNSTTPLSSDAVSTPQDTETQLPVYNSILSSYIDSTTTLSYVNVSTLKDTDTQLFVYSSAVPSFTESKTQLSTVISGIIGDIETQQSVYSSTVPSSIDSTSPLSNVNIRTFETTETRPSLYSSIVPSYTESTGTVAATVVGTFEDAETTPSFYRSIISSQTDITTSESAFAVSTTGDTETFFSYYSSIVPPNTDSIVIPDTAYKSLEVLYTDIISPVSVIDINTLGGTDKLLPSFSSKVHSFSDITTSVSPVNDSILRAMDIKSSIHSSRVHSYTNLTIPMSASSHRSMDTQSSVYNPTKPSYTGVTISPEALTVSSLEDMDTVSNIQSFVVTSYTGVTTQVSIASEDSLRKTDTKSSVNVPLGTSYAEIITTDTISTQIEEIETELSVYGSIFSTFFDITTPLSPVILSNFRDIETQSSVVSSYIDIATSESSVTFNTAGITEITSSFYSVLVSSYSGITTPLSDVNFSILDDTETQLSSYISIELSSSGITLPLSAIGASTFEAMELWNTDLTTALSTVGVSTLDGTETQWYLHSSIEHSNTDMTTTLSTFDVSTLESKEIQSSVNNSIEPWNTEITTPMSTVSFSILDDKDTKSSIYSSIENPSTDVTTLLSTIGASTLKSTEIQTSINSSIEPWTTGITTPMSTVSFSILDNKETKSSFYRSIENLSTVVTTLLSTIGASTLKSTEIQTSINSSIEPWTIGITTALSTVSFSILDDKDTKSSIYSSIASSHTDITTSESDFAVSTTGDTETFFSDYSSIVPPNTDSIVIPDTVYMTTHSSVYNSLEMLYTYISPVSVIDINTLGGTDKLLPSYSSIVRSFSDITTSVSAVNDSILRAMDTKSSIHSSRVHPYTNLTIPMSASSHRSMDTQSSVYIPITPSYTAVTTSPEAFTVSSRDGMDTVSNIQSFVVTSYTGVTTQVPIASDDRLRKTDTKSSVNVPLGTSYVEIITTDTISTQIEEIETELSVYGSIFSTFFDITTPLSPVNVSNFGDIETQSSVVSSYIDIATSESSVTFNTVSNTEITSYIYSFVVPSYSDITTPMLNVAFSTLDDTETQSSSYISIELSRSGITLPLSDIGASTFEDIEPWNTDLTTALSTVGVSILDGTETQWYFYSSVEPSKTDITTTLTTFNVSSLESKEIHSSINSSIEPWNTDTTTPMSTVSFSILDDKETKSSIYSSIENPSTVVTTLLSTIGASTLKSTEIQTSINSSIEPWTIGITTTLSTVGISTLDDTEITSSMYSFTEPSKTATTIPLSTVGVGTYNGTETQPSFYSSIQPSLTEIKSPLSTVGVSTLNGVDKYSSFYSSIEPSNTDITTPLSNISVSTLQVKETESSIYSSIEPSFTDLTFSLSTVGVSTLNVTDTQSSFFNSKEPSNSDVATPLSNIVVSTFYVTETQSSIHSSVKPSFTKITPSVSTVIVSPNAVIETKSSAYSSINPSFTDITTSVRTISSSIFVDIDPQLSFISSLIHSYANFSTEVLTVSVNTHSTPLTTVTPLLDMDTTSTFPSSVLSSYTVTPTPMTSTSGISTSSTLFEGSSSFYEPSGPVDPLSLLIMTILLKPSTDLTELTLTEDLEKGLLLCYEEALSKLQSSKRKKRQDGSSNQIQVEVNSLTRDVSDPTSVDVEFYVSNGGEVLPATEVEGAFNQLSLVETSAYLTYPVLTRPRAVIQTTKPEEPDDSSILPVLVAIPVVLLVASVVVITLVIYCCRKRRRGDTLKKSFVSSLSLKKPTLDEMDLMVDMERGEVVSRKSSSSTLNVKPSTSDTNTLTNVLLQLQETGAAKMSDMQFRLNDVQYFQRSLSEMCSPHARIERLRKLGLNVSDLNARSLYRISEANTSNAMNTEPETSNAVDKDVGALNMIPDEGHGGSTHEQVISHNDTNQTSKENQNLLQDEQEEKLWNRVTFIANEGYLSDSSNRQINSVKSHKDGRSTGTNVPKVISDSTNRGKRQKSRAPDRNRHLEGKRNDRVTTNRVTTNRARNDTETFERPNLSVDGFSNSIFERPVSSVIPLLTHGNEAGSIYKGGNSDYETDTDSVFLPSITDPDGEYCSLNEDSFNTVSDINYDSEMYTESDNKLSHMSIDEYLAAEMGANFTGRKSDIFDRTKGDHNPVEAVNDVMYKYFEPMQTPYSLARYSTQHYKHGNLIGSGADCVENIVEKEDDARDE